MTLWGKPHLPVAAMATMAATHLPTHNLAEHLKHQLHHDIFFMLIVHTHLRHHCHCRHPPKMPLPKLAELNLQEIPRVLPHFCIGVVVVLRCDTIAIAALQILPPNDLQQH